MIICFLKKIKNFCENNLKNFDNFEQREKYMQSLMPDLSDVSDNICPHCNAKNKLVRFGKYNRNLSVLVDNTLENYCVSVQRVICKSCGSTHALLPDFIVPYKIMAVFSIAKIVQNAAISSAYKLAETINLSYQAIYSYIAVVLAFFTDFKILNNSKEYKPSQNFNEKYFLQNCIVLSSTQFKLDFFEFFNWALFMSKFRNNPSPPIVISISKMSST